MISEKKILSTSIIQNLKLKTKIIFILFAVVLTFQIVGLLYLRFNQNDILKKIPTVLVVMGPALLFTATIMEYYLLRSLNKQEKNNLKKLINQIYLVQFIEISFPSLVLFIAGTFTSQIEEISRSELFASPPLIMYFILIMLTSLNLDRRLCILTGTIASIEYLLLIFWFKNEMQQTHIIIPSLLIRSVLLFISGVVSGFVAGKIKESVLISLEAQQNLINKLDHLVNEKTKEIQEQNTALNQRQKEILDSITYAKRIQNSLLPSEYKLAKDLKKSKK